MDTLLYRYCFSSPLRFTDPFGAVPLEDIPGRKHFESWNGYQAKFEEWYQANKDTSWALLLDDCPCNLELRKVLVGCSAGTGGPGIPVVEIRWMVPAGYEALFEQPTRFNLGWTQTVPETWLWHDYHPGAVFDVRSKSKDGHNQQCTYDKNGQLITGGLGVGTADKGNSFTHYRDDMLPFHWAKFLDTYGADGVFPGHYMKLYWEVRPPAKGVGCKENRKP